MVWCRIMFWVATAFAVLLQAVAQEMTIDGGAWETPRMTDEDIQGQDVPQYLACDACRAVVGHARQALRQAESERSGKQLSEAAAIEVFEERVCQFNRKKLLDVDPDSFWHDYGVKLVDGGPRQGDKVLDGDALPDNKRLPGVKRGGGSTLPGRLSRRCAELVGEVGENELYAILRDTWQDSNASERELADTRAEATPYDGLTQTQEVVCTELTTWCGSNNKKPKPKKSKKEKSTKKKKKKTKNKAK